MIALQTHRVSDTRSLRVDTPVRLLSGSGTRDTNLFRRNYQKLRTSPQRFQPFSHFFFTAINLLIFGYDAFAIDICRYFRIRVIYQKKMDGKWV